jgi:hypothetical protein
MLRVVGLILLASASISGQAQSPGITYDCDTASGHFSQLILPAPAGDFTVTGLVQINQTYPNKTWMPVGKMMIGPPPPSPGAPQPVYAGFSFGALPGKAISRPEKTVQYLSFIAKGKEDEIIVPTFQALGPAHRFSARATATELTVTVGNEARTYALPAGPKAIQILCSTGEFLFTDLVIAPAP